MLREFIDNLTKCCAIASVLELVWNCCIAKSC